MSGRSDALTRLADVLVCPHCGDPLTMDATGAGCAAGHRFDAARQGYLNLLRGSAATLSDTPAMVAARDRFLTADHYWPVVDALVEALADTPSGATATLLEPGAGTGWYLARVLDAFGDARGLATDLSVPAVRRAARCHPRAAAVVADTWAGLPVADGVVDAVLNVFSPRNLPEFARVLRPGGTLVVAIPQPDHLAELRTELGLLEVAADKRERLESTAGGWFEMVAQTEVRRELDLDAAAVHDLVAMGPNAFHTPPEITQGRRVRLAVDVLSWRRTA